MSTTNHNNKEKTLIFVYGTLKQGFPNHHILHNFLSSEDAVFVGIHQTVEPYPLVCGPLGIPFLINRAGSGCRVRGELYSVSSRALTRLDELEGLSRGHYERLPVAVTATQEFGRGEGTVKEVEAYFAHRSFGEEMWEKNGEVGMEEYKDKEGEKYVRVENRDVGLNLRDYIRLYIQRGGDHA